MALTAGMGSSGDKQEDGGGGAVELSRGGGGGEERKMRMRREHMFDKVVTPSDVGKLNRLVVPKHFAERHFLPQVLGDGGPGRVAGAVLRFADGRGSGKSWEFRFSYWGSSQSYVMTKGWSSFVRDRRLSAGDTVSFYCAGASLFIDCRRRGAGVAASVPAATRLVVPASVPQVVTLMHQLSTSSDERAPRSRCVRLFGVDLELTGARAEQLPLDLQLALTRR